MILQKWDYSTKSYKPYRVDDKLNIKVMCRNMSELINCASCFRDMTFGDGYTSLVIHTASGFGYPVCGRCYDKEQIERSKHDERN